ncbi:B3 domain-containing protein_Os12g40080-like [Euphorbia lathyris]|uniref:B3 domain-containing protein_Os12g40080-like n=1 Tax=Euphorbia lathyris TaxID=212925 RepID=UPI003313A7A9
MASAPKSTMTFIKLLVLVFEFATRIKLPGLLVKMFKEMIPKLCTLRSHTGKSCEVSIERKINDYFFRQGWDKFLKENKLQEGDVLVFNLVDETTFEVFAYGATCCLKEPQIQIQIPTSESENISSKPEVSARITGLFQSNRSIK